MIEANWNHCQIVRDNITGERAVDEQAFASLAILTERLKKLGKTFSGVTFSPAVKKLKRQKNTVAVG